MDDWQEHLLRVTSVDTVPTVIWPSPYTHTYTPGAPVTQRPKGRKHRGKSLLQGDSARRGRKAGTDPTTGRLTGGISGHGWARQQVSV